MSTNILILPGLALIGGIILRITDYMSVFTIAGGTSEWTLEMGTTVFYIRLVLSILLFVIIGIIVRRIYDRKTIVKSATLLVIYSILLLALEQIMQLFFTYNPMVYWLYLPLEIFTTITSLLARISSGESITWIYAVPSLFAPYLFLLFGEKSESAH